MYMRVDSLYFSWPTALILSIQFTSAYGNDYGNQDPRHHQLHLQQRLTLKMIDEAVKTIKVYEYVKTCSPIKKTSNTRNAIYEYVQLAGWDALRKTKIKKSVQFRRN